MVADEGPWHEGGEQIGIAPQGPVQLVEVRLRQGVPDRLPQLVLGNGVHARGGHDGGVVSVDDLAHDVDLRMVAAHPGEHSRPESRIDGVGRIQSPAVHAALAPVGHDIGDQVHHGLAGVVELGKPVLALEAPVVGRNARGPCFPGFSGSPGFSACFAARPVASRPRQVEHGGLAGVGAGFGQGSEGRVVDADVVEDAVEHDPHPPDVGGVDEGEQVLIRAQSGVEPHVVDRVVSVRHRVEDGAEHEHVAAELDKAVEPGQQAAQAVLGRHRPGR